MNLKENYYKILEVDFDCSKKEIKTSYRKLSLKYHPDKSKNEDFSIFNKITEAYKVLFNDKKRKEYDKKSQFGKNYNEMEEFFSIDINKDDLYEQSNKRYKDFKDKELLDIIVKVNVNKFENSLTYKRWVLCKKCDGTGTDMSNKILIIDENGNEKYFEADNGCDFCEGTGKDRNGNECNYCKGKGKVGLNPCKNCKGDKRIKGKQTMKNIKLDLDKEETIIKASGNQSVEGKTGDLIIVHKNSDEEL